MRPLPDAADVVIVGAGIMGLATAYHLAKEHAKRRIVVLDAGYLCGGASGRNGGFATSWWQKLSSLIEMYGDDEGMRLAQESAAAVAAIQCELLSAAASCRPRFNEAPEESQLASNARCALRQPS